MRVQPTLTTAIAFGLVLNAGNAGAETAMPDNIAQGAAISSEELYEYVRLNELTPIAKGVRQTPAAPLETDNEHASYFNEQNTYIFANEDTGEWLLVKAVNDGTFSVDHRGHNFVMDMGTANATPISLRSYTFNTCANITDSSYNAMPHNFIGVDDSNQLVTISTPYLTDDNNLWRVIVANPQNPNCSMYYGLNFTSYESVLDEKSIMLDFSQWPDYETLVGKQELMGPMRLPSPANH
jgi:hypothetical protein